MVWWSLTLHSAGTFSSSSQVEWRGGGRAGLCRLPLAPPSVGTELHSSQDTQGVSGYCCSENSGRGHLDQLRWPPSAWGTWQIWSTIRLRLVTSAEALDPSEPHLLFDIIVGVDIPGQTIPVTAVDPSNWEVFLFWKRHPPGSLQTAVHCLSFPSRNAHFLVFFARSLPVFLPCQNGSSQMGSIHHLM